MFSDTLAGDSSTLALPFFKAILDVAISTLAYTSHVPSFLSSHGIDKVLHATMTLTLTLLLARALRGRVLLAAIMIMTPVAIDEYMQRFSPSRSSDWADLIADVVGVMLAITITRWRSPRDSERDRAMSG